MGRRRYTRSRAASRVACEGRYSGGVCTIILVFCPHDLLLEFCTYVSCLSEIVGINSFLLCCVLRESGRIRLYTEQIYLPDSRWTQKKTYPIPPCRSATTSSIHRSRSKVMYHPICPAGQWATFSHGPHRGSLEPGTGRWPRRKKQSIKSAPIGALSTTAERDWEWGRKRLLERGRKRRNCF